MVSIVKSLVQGGVDLWDLVYIEIAAQPMYGIPVRMGGAGLHISNLAAGPGLCTSEPGYSTMVIYCGTRRTATKIVDLCGAKKAQATLQRTHMATSWLHPFYEGINDIDEYLLSSEDKEKVTDVY